MITQIILPLMRERGMVIGVSNWWYRKFNEHNHDSHNCNPNFSFVKLTKYICVGLYLNLIKNIHAINDLNIVFYPIQNHKNRLCLKKRKMMHYLYDKLDQNCTKLVNCSEIYVKYWLSIYCNNGDMVSRGQQMFLHTNQI